MGLHAGVGVGKHPACVSLGFATRLCLTPYVRVVGERLHQRRYPRKCWCGPARYAPHACRARHTRNTRRTWRTFEVIQCTVNVIQHPYLCIVHVCTDPVKPALVPRAPGRTAVRGIPVMVEWWLHTRAPW